MREAEVLVALRLGAGSLITLGIKFFEHGCCHGPGGDELDGAKEDSLEELTGGFEQSRKAWEQESCHPYSVLHQDWNCNLTISKASVDRRKTTP